MKMKTKTAPKYSRFQKFMLVIVPVVILLLIVSIVMCAAFSLLPMPVSAIVSTGNLTLVFAVCSTALAILALLFAIFSKSGENDEASEDYEIK